ncbi:DNA primase [Allopusillimonas ginsengisoli]|nr:DNA primase [Allopusillimonas ginsengisoli]
MKGLFIAALLMASFSANAVEDKEIATCAAETNSVLRLACFDSLAERHSLAPSTQVATATDGAGEWIVRTKTDPLNDKSIYTASLFASSGMGKYGDPIALSVRCANNKTEMYINWASYLGRGTIRTSHRIDKEKAITNSWDISTDGKAAFHPGSPIGTLKRLVASTSFVANLTPYNENPITAVFETAGADVALAEIRKGCNW